MDGLYSGDRGLVAAEVIGVTVMSAIEIASQSVTCVDVDGVGTAGKSGGGTGCWGG